MCISSLYYFYKHSFTNNIVKVLYMICTGIIRNALYNLLYICMYIPAYMYLHIFYLYINNCLYINNTHDNYDIYNVCIYSSMCISVFLNVMVTAVQ